MAFLAEWLECCIRGEEQPTPLLSSARSAKLVKTGMLNMKIEICCMHVWRQRFCALYDDGRLKHFRSQAHFSNGDSGHTIDVESSACVFVKFPKVPMLFSGGQCALEVTNAVHTLYIHHNDPAVTRAWADEIVHVGYNSSRERQQQYQSILQIENSTPESPATTHSEGTESTIASLLSKPSEQDRRRSEVAEIRRLLTD